MIFAGTRGYLDPIAGRRRAAVRAAAAAPPARASTPTILGEIAGKKEITADTEKKLVGVLDKFAKSFAA